MVDSSLDKPSAFKSLLDVVRCETYITKDADAASIGNRLNEAIQELINHVNLLSKKFCDSNWNDLQALSNHFFRCVNRLISNHFYQLLKKYEERGLVVHFGLLKTKLDISLISCLQSFFQHYLSSNSSQLSDWNSEQLQTLQSILGSMAIMFETVKNTLPTNGTGTSLTSDQEILVGVLFDTLAIILVTLFSIPRDYFDDFLQMEFRRQSAALIDSTNICEVKETFLSDIRGQFIHTCIVFLSHKSKEIASKAIRCLLVQLTVITSTRHLSFWRNSFPGIFGGICIACKQDIKGSQTVALFLAAIMKLIEVVCSVQNAENKALLSRLSLLAGQNHLSFARVSDELLFDETDSTEIPIPGFSSLEKFQEWRVLMIQKIERTFPSIYRSAVVRLSSKQRHSLLARFMGMMNSASAFLGTSCFLQFLLCFMSHYHDDCESARLFCRDQIGTIITKLNSISPTMALGVQSSLSTFFVECVQSAGQLSNSLNSSNLLPQQLSQLIALGKHLKHQLRFLISGDADLFSKAVEKLFMVDYKAAKSLAMETRCYHTNRNQSKRNTCEASYFRLSWLATNDNSTARLLREFAVLCGEYGDMAFVCERVEENLHKMEKLHWGLIHRREAIVGNWNVIARYRSLCSQTHAFLHFLRYSIFGGFTRTFVVSQSTVSNMKACSVCGQEDCKLRCSRCKCTYYCSKAHQTKDWKTHKIVCEVIEDELPEDQEMFTDDPEIILFSEGSMLEQKGTDMYSLLVPIYLRIISNFLIVFGILKSRSAKSFAHQNVALVFPTLALLTGQIIESIGDLPKFVSSYEFSRLLSKSLLYYLLEIMVLEESVTSLAARSTVSRIALYLSYDNVNTFLRDNLDFVVEDACSRFRQTFCNEGEERYLHESETSRYSLNTMVDSSINVDKVVGLVFKTCNIRYQEDSSHSEQRYILILKDMVMNSLKHIDAEAMSSSLNYHSLSSMIQVLQILAKAVDLEVSAINKSGRLIECCPWLRDNRQSNITDNIERIVLIESRSIQPVVLRSLINFDRSLVVLGNLSVDEHGDDKQGLGEEKSTMNEEEDNSENDIIDSPSAKLLQDICDRIGFFVKLPYLNLQSAAFEALSVALLGLSKYEKQFLPAIHQVWPFLNQALEDIVQQFWNINHHHTHLLVDEGANNQTSLIESGTIHSRHHNNRNLTIKEERLGDERNLFHLVEDNIIDNIVCEYPLSSSVLHLLPSVVRLLSQIVILAPDFISGRIQRDIWPKLLQLLHGYFEVYGRIGPRRLDKYPLYLKHSVDSKVKQSIIGFVDNLLSEQALFNLTKDKIKAFYFFMIPWVSKIECEEVQILANRSLSIMESREKSFIQQIRKSSCCAGDNNLNPHQRTALMKKWLMIGSDPELLGDESDIKTTKCFRCNKTTLMNIWEMYQQDEGVRRIFENAISSNNHSPMKVQSWNNQMDKWSRM